MAMIADESDNRIFHETELFRFVQKISQPGVQHGYFPGIKRTGMLQLSFGQIVKLMGVKTEDHFGPIIPGIIHVHVVLWRVPGFMGIKAVNTKKERFTLFIVFFQPSNGGTEYLRRQVIFFSPPQLFASEVTGHQPGGGGVSIHLGGEIFFNVDGILGAGTIEVVFLPTDPAPFAETPVEIHAWLEHVINIGDKGSCVSPPLKNFR